MRTAEHVTRVEKKAKTQPSFSTSETGQRYVAPLASDKLTNEAANTPQVKGCIKW